MATRSLNSRVSSAFVIAAVLLGPAVAAAAPGDPVVAQLLGAEPRFLYATEVPFAQQLDQSYGLGICPAAGGCVLGPGTAHRPEERALRVYLGFRTQDATDKPADALGATASIRLCFKRAGVPPVCPPAWVLYDQASGVGSLPAAASIATDPAKIAGQAVDLWGPAGTKIDWSDPAWAGTAVFVAVNGPSSVAKDVSLGGAVLDWELLASSPSDQRFLVYGTPHHTPFDPVVVPGPPPATLPPLDVCASGGATNVCVTPAIAEYVRKLAVAEQDAHEQRVQAPLTGAQLHLSWRNGLLPSGAPGPTRILLGYHPDAYGQADVGAFHMNAEAVQSIHPVPSDDPHVVLIGPGYDARDVLRLHTHEYFHQLQIGWGFDSPAANPHINSLLGSEAAASSVEYNLCLKLNPADPNECISAGKMGLHGNGAYGAFRKFAVQPDVDFLTQSYTSALFWRYVMEQFSYPVSTSDPQKTNTAHPSGTPPSNAVSRPGTSPFPLQGRPSDEGVDVFTRVFQEYEATPSGVSTQAATSNALKKHLGRSLDDVLFDLHTAVFLKDYNDTGDARWRLDWVGDYTSSALPDRPFLPPPPGSAWTPTPDFLAHPYRVLDDWVDCAPTPLGGLPPTCTSLTWATRKTLPVGGGVQSSTAAGVGKHGAALMSVHPAAGWVGKSLTVRAQGTNSMPRFRVFRVKFGGTFLNPVLLPEPVCPPPDFECTPTSLGSGGWALSVPVPVLSSTDEVLLLASGTSAPSPFTWSFGETTGTLTIDAPTAAVPALVGYPKNPAPLPGGMGRKPFLAQMTLRDAANQPIVITDKSMVSVSVPGCAAPPCVLGPTDFQILPLSGGNLFVSVRLPVSFYPLPPPASTVLLPLQVTAAGLTATRPDAIRMALGDGEDATVFALDRSSDLLWQPLAGGGNVFDAIKSVTKALVTSMLPAPGEPARHRAALVAYAGDATTIFAPTLVDASTAGVMSFLIDSVGPQPGGASLGDAILESQSLLACAFDSVPTATQPDRQAVMLLAGGGSVTPATPDTYYAYGCGQAPKADGDGPWCSAPLERACRLQLGLPVPVISTVAFGKNADLSELGALTKAGGGTLTYLPGPETGVKLYDYITTVSDALTASYVVGSGYQPVTSATRAVDGTPTTIEVEPGATELRIVALSREKRGLGLALSLLPPREGSGATSMEETDDAIILRVQAPVDGAWLVVPRTTAAPGPERVLHIDAGVQSTTSLFVTLDAADRLPLRGGSTPGVEMLVRAVLVGDEPTPRCAMDAVIETPSGRIHRVALKDDGRSVDGAAVDGVHGARFAHTGEEGSYGVTLIATCDLASGGHVQRRVKRAFGVTSGVDADGDGMSDAWERRVGLDPTDATDAARDDDGDGLSNAEEQRLSTHPRRADSDGAGESDGSEVAAGRDPLSADDDAIGAPRIVAIAGNARVLLDLGIDPGPLGVDVERRLEGEIDAVGIQASGVAGSGWYRLDQSVPNGSRACYRVRLSGAGATSAWSGVACATPQVDPIAPVVEVASVPSRSRTRELSFALRVLDPGSLARSPVDLGTRPTGVDAIRVSADASFAGAAWKAPAERVTIRLPDRATSTLWIQARDTAGNVSQPVSTQVDLVARTHLDRALLLEERAQDLLQGGASAAARKAITESLVNIEASIADVAKRQASCKHPDPRDIHIAVELARIWAKKQEARALVGVPTKSLTALRSALDRERALATWADENGASL